MKILKLQLGNNIKYRDVEVHPDLIKEWDKKNNSFTLTDGRKGTWDDTELSYIIEPLNTDLKIELSRRKLPYEKPLKLVSPEFTLLTGGKGLFNMSKTGLLPSTELIGKGFNNYLNITNPSTIMKGYGAVGNYTTPLGTTGASLSGALADTSLASSGLYSVGKLFYDSPNTVSGTELALTLPFFPFRRSKLLSKIMKNEFIPKTPEEWDKLYFEAIKINDKDAIQKIRDLHYLQNSKASDVTRTENRPRTWYHGSDKSGTTSFIPWRHVRTNGNSGNYNYIGTYLTDDLNSASSYANKYAEEKIKSLNVPNTSFQKVLDKLGLFNRKLRHPDIDAIPDNLRFNPDLYHTDEVYPFYVNPSNVYTYDFKGKGWGSAPDKLSPYYRVKVSDNKPGELLHYNIRDFNNLKLADEEYKKLQDKYNMIYEYTKPVSDGRTYKELKTHINFDYPKWINSERKEPYPYDTAKNIILEEKYHLLNTAGVTESAGLRGYDSALMTNVNDGFDPKPIINDLSVIDNTKFKYAWPITYDNNGKIIPISLRDNWNIPDIRYIIIPGLGLTTGLNFKNKNNANK